MTTRYLVCALAGLATCLVPGISTADPIHARANGEYWHHDSGWVFPERIGNFVRVGLPQDVAGSQDAVAHYAWVRQGVRIVAAVDVFPADSAAVGTTLESARSALAGPAESLVQTELPLANTKLHAARVTGTAAPAAATRALYFVVAGQWRVRIQVDAPVGAVELGPELDAFVRAQRWDTLL
jgi:hypothetical protein